MTTDIIIKSYAGDFEWLTFCLKSIARFATGFRRVLVLVPQGQTPPTGTNETVFHINERMDGYMEQQNLKLHADAFSNADYLLFMDSDTIFTRPITPHDAIAPGGKVHWLYTPRKNMGKASDVWRKETEKAMKQPVQHEFMRRHPFCVPRWALEGLRAWFWRAHGQSLESYIADQPDRQFSEWNVLGAWLWLHHHERVNWINTEVELGVPYVHQSYSWGGINTSTRGLMEAALA